MTQSWCYAQTGILDFEEMDNHKNTQYLQEIIFARSIRLGIIIVHAPVCTHMMDKKMDSEFAKIIDLTAE